MTHPQQRQRKIRICHAATIKVLGDRPSMVHGFLGEFLETDGQEEGIKECPRPPPTIWQTRLPVYAVDAGWFWPL